MCMPKYCIYAYMCIYIYAYVCACMYIYNMYLTCETLSYQQSLHIAEDELDY